MSVVAGDDEDDDQETEQGEKWKRKGRESHRRWNKSPEWENENGYENDDGVAGDVKPWMTVIVTLSLEKKWLGFREREWVRETRSIYY